MAHERKCSVCGKIYRYCSRCAEFKDQPRWKSVYCSDRCRTNYTILNEYAFGQMTATSAKAGLTDVETIKNTGLLEIVEKLDSDVQTKEESETSKTKKKKTKDE